MDIPINAEVSCMDGLCGRSTYVLVNPVAERVTHLVVKQAETPHTERMVPIEVVSETSPDVVMLSCTKDELKKMDPFIQTEYITEKMPDLYADRTGFVGLNAYMVWPYAVPEKTVLVTVEHKQIPLGELAVKRGARVEATDGHVGQMDEFLVNPENEHITHLVMREGHLWGQKDVTIPVSEIDRISGNTVYLKLDKQQIEALPAIPIRRWRD